MKKLSLKQKIFSFPGRGYVIVSKHADPTVKQRAQESSKAAAETLTQSWNYISAHELDYIININDFVLLAALDRSDTAFTFIFCLYDWHFGYTLTCIKPATKTTREWGYNKITQVALWEM